MPIVLRAEGFTFSFYAGDHDPPHVHASYGGGRCKVVLGTLDVADLGMKLRDQVRAVWIVQEHRDELLAAWFTFQQRKM